MRKVNQNELKKLNSALERTIREAKWLEDLELKGSSLEQIDQEARDFLGLSKEDSIIEKHLDIVKENNSQVNGLIQVNTLIHSLNEKGLGNEDQIKALIELEEELSQKVKNIYGIDDSVLFKEE